MPPELDTSAATDPPPPSSDFGLLALDAPGRWERTRPTRRDRLAWLLLGRHTEPPKSAIGVLEHPREDSVGICCSGGGIRSASFNLGALQALQDAGRLRTAKYLAAVSGGSYIASAFCMVAKTWDPGAPDPKGDDSDPKLVTQESPPFHRGSPEEQYLRNHASYIAPSGMGKLLLVWRVVCGLLVNLLFIASVLGLAAAVLALYYRHAHHGLVTAPGRQIEASPAAWLEDLALALALFGLLLGIAAILIRPRLATMRGVFETWSLYFIAAGIVVFVFEVVVPELLQEIERQGATTASSPGLSGTPGTIFGGGVAATVASILAAVFAQIRAPIADPREAIKAAKQVDGVFKKLGPRLRHLAVLLAAWVAGPLLLFALLVAATLFQVNPPRHMWLLLFPAIAFVIFFMLDFVVADLTTWSLHPMYRRRLCTAFALKRVSEGGTRAIARERTEGELVPLSQTGVVSRTPWWNSRDWPTLLVCAAANISDPGATPPGRSVTSFTFSPAAIGGPLVGGIATGEFEKKLKYGQRDFTLPAAVAMSGAAVSPSMGKLTRPSLRFLMGLANVRLGVWVPNPRRLDAFVKTRTTGASLADGAGATFNAFVTGRAPDGRADEVRDAAEGRRLFRPRPRPRYLVKELLGWNSVNDKYLYVTDGGHYENLGLVELLRRGCTQIYCFDATAGKHMSALGDAIALARSELCVEIEFRQADLDALAEKGHPPIASARSAVGTITYPGTPEIVGTLVYAPSVMSPNLPWDVQAYSAGDPAFPHNSTVDQLFTDQKFEAYRVLGRETGKAAIAAMDGVVKPPVGGRTRVSD